LADDRTRIDLIEREAVEARAFVLLMLLAAAVVAPLWVLHAPIALRAVYTMLAFALPATLLISNPDLTTFEKPAA
jgi:hypothetical protein